MTRTLRRGLVVPAWLMISAALVPSTWAQTDAKSLITQAFEKTKTATTAEDFSAIIAECEQAQRGPLSKQMSDYAPQLRAWAHNRRGETYTIEAAEALASGAREAAERLDERALADFEMAVKLDPQHWKSRHNRGVSYGLLGEHEKAIADFSAALELNPGYIDGLFNRAEMYLEVGKYENAIADYEGVIAVRADDRVAHLKRGVCYLRRGAIDQALSDFNTAITMDDSDGLGYVRRGSAYETLGQWSNAAKDYRQAIAKDPASTAAYLHAAWLMATCPDARFRNVELAIQAAEKAKELSPAPPTGRMLDVLAASYANAGRFTEAAELATQAVARVPLPQRAELEQRIMAYRQKKPYRQADRVATNVAAGTTRPSR